MREMGRGDALSVIYYIVLIIVLEVQSVFEKECIIVSGR